MKDEAPFYLPVGHAWVMPWDLSTEALLKFLLIILLQPKSDGLHPTSSDGLQPNSILSHDSYQIHGRTRSAQTLPHKQVSLRLLFWQLLAGLKIGKAIQITFKRIKFRGKLVATWEFRLLEIKLSPDISRARI